MKFRITIKHKLTGVSHNFDVDAWGGNELGSIVEIETAISSFFKRHKLKKSSFEITSKPVDDLPPQGIISTDLKPEPTIKKAEEGGSAGFGF